MAQKISADAPAYRLVALEDFLQLPPRFHGKFRQQTTSRTGPASKGLARMAANAGSARGGENVLWTIFVVLLVLWLLGIVSSYTLGGFIHLLLLLALVVLILQLVSGRRPVV